MSKIPRHSVLILLTLLYLGCGDSEKTSFRIEVDIQPSAAASEGLRFSVDGDSTERMWSADYASLDDACTALDSNPLRIDCRDADDVSCGTAQVIGVCCWADDVLSSPIVKGTVYLQFSGDGSHVMEEGDCEALDGTSTHGDGRSPDGGA